MRSLCHPIFNFAVQWSFPRIWYFWGWTRIHSRVSRHIGLRYIPHTTTVKISAAAVWVALSGELTVPSLCANYFRAFSQSLHIDAYQQRNLCKTCFNLRTCFCFMRSMLLYYYDLSKQYFPTKATSTFQIFQFLIEEQIQV